VEVGVDVGVGVGVDVGVSVGVEVCVDVGVGVGVKEIVIDGDGRIGVGSVLSTFPGSGYSCSLQSNEESVSL
jgi:hypothetical protein